MGSSFLLTGAVPIGRAGRRPCFGFDEDGWTLLAAAWEASLARAPAVELPDAVDLFGDLPDVADAGLVALGPRPPSVRRNARDVPIEHGFDRLRSGEASAVVGFGAGAEGSGPFAFVLRATARGAPPELPPGPVPTAPAIGHRELAEPPATFADVRDLLTFDGYPTTPIDAAARSRWESLPLAIVSQGAYLPRDRYLEELPTRWGLRAERCSACGATLFPARGRCRACGATDRLVPFPLPRQGGVVVARTRVGPGGQPTEFDPMVEATGPYGVVLVEPIPGVRVTLPTTDEGAGSLRIGDRVGTALRRLYPMEGEWRYGRKALPLLR